MHYIVCAFKPEARPLIERFGLVPEKTLPWPLFRSDGIALIVCGLGHDNALAATAALLGAFAPDRTSRLFNVGICAAPERWPIGTLLQASALWTHSRPISLATFPKIARTLLQSVDTPCDSPCDHAVDMEAFGIFTAARRFLPKTHIHVLKIVSDHFSPDSVDIHNVEHLIAAHIDRIETLI